MYIKRIEVIKSLSDLTRQVWSFWFNDSDATLYLDIYTLESRSTKKCKWKIDAGYSRLRGDSWFLNSLHSEEVPWSAEIEKEALDTFIKTISIKKEFKRS